MSVGNEEAEVKVNVRYIPGKWTNVPSSVYSAFRLMRSHTISPNISSISVARTKSVGYNCSTDVSDSNLATYSKEVKIHLAKKIKEVREFQQAM